MPYSEKMHTPELQKYRNLAMGIKWNVMLPLVAAVVICALGIFHYASDRVDPVALWTGAAVALVVVLFFTLVLPLLRQGGYEAVIYNKKIVKTHVKEGQDTETYTQYHFAPILFIRSASGAKHQLEVSKEAYAYFSIGDTIMVHRGFSHPEKRDKEGDSVILCPRCGHTFGIEQEQCPSCQMPSIV